jgi:transposase
MKTLFEREEIIRLIGEYQRSGMRQREFTEAQGIRYSTFTQWLAKGGPAACDRRAQTVRLLTQSQQLGSDNRSFMGNPRVQA